MKKGESKISHDNFFPKNRGRWNKSGQFYLIAAIVIISVIVGFTSVSNYSKKKTNEKINDLRDELQIETGKIVEYGVNYYPTISYKQDISRNQLKEIAEIYTSTTEIESMYFILGDTTRVAISAYLEPFPDTLTIDGIPLSFDEEVTNNFKIIYYAPAEETITIGIEGIDYKFELKPGVNLYFIISKEDYVATNKV